jgi:pimeloyl-ACP methyl ester carboxylesterase
MRIVEFKNQDGATLRGVLRNGTAPRAIIFSHGLERTSITEQKFKRLADTLEQHGVTSFAFDYTGCGLSDGDFSRTTVQRLTDDFIRASVMLKKKTDCLDMCAVGHSISGCVMGLAQKTAPKLLSKIALLGPALNMAAVLRWKFAYDIMQKKQRCEQITWQNFHTLFSEEDFLTYCQSGTIILRAHYLGKDFFTENMNKDYSQCFAGEQSNVLLIHGAKDKKVPLESLTVSFQHSIIIPEGDHELERPHIMAQWLNPCVDFLLES